METEIKDENKVIVSVTLKHLYQLFKMGKNRIKINNMNDKSEIETIKKFRFEITSDNFLDFVRVCLKGEKQKYE